MQKAIFYIVFSGVLLCFLAAITGPARRYAEQISLGKRDFVLQDFTRETRIKIIITIIAIALALLYPIQ